MKTPSEFTEYGFSFGAYSINGHGHVMSYIAYRRKRRFKSRVYGRWDSNKNQYIEEPANR